MRAIKFRGKTINGEWVYGDLIQIGGGALIYHGDKQELEVIPQEDSPCAVGFYPNEISPVIPKTVGQFTGIKDRNGAEIFEGDIMQHANPFDIPFIVNWIDSECCYGFNYGSTSYVITDTSFTVIGNVFENPQLLDVAY